MPSNGTAETLSQRSTHRYIRHRVIGITNGLNGLLTLAAQRQGAV